MLERNPFSVDDNNSDVIKSREKSSSRFSNIKNESSPNQAKNPIGSSPQEAGRQLLAHWERNGLKFFWVSWGRQYEWQITTELSHIHHDTLMNGWQTSRAPLMKPSERRQDPAAITDFPGILVITGVPGRCGRDLGSQRVQRSQTPRPTALTSKWVCTSWDKSRESLGIKYLLFNIFLFLNLWLLLSKFHIHIVRRVSSIGLFTEE